MAARKCPITTHILLKLLRDKNPLHLGDAGRRSFCADAVIVSDIHLGSSNCNASHFSEFLSRILNGSLQTGQLILNGDVFDSIDFRRLNKHHWEVLSLLRKLSDRVLITWVCGNHDGPADAVSHLLGVQVRDEYIFTSGGRRVLVMHGHAFDDFIDAHPQITWFADVLYRLLQSIDRSHRFAKFAKTNSKIFLRCVQKVLDGAVAFGAERKVDAVCCGHTHHAESSYSGAIDYHNSGCWTESPCTYLSVSEGEVRLHTFRTEKLEVPATLAIQPTPAVSLQF